MSLRKQAKILGTSHANLSRMISGKRKWNPQLKARYDALVGTTLVPVGGNGGTNILYPRAERGALLGTNQGNGGRYKGRTCDLCDVNAAL